MQLLSLLLPLAPLVIFVLVDIYGNLRYAVISAMVTAVALLFFYYLLLGFIDETMIIEAILIVALGVISLKMKNPIFFKFQPAVVDVCFAIFLAWFQFFDTPWMLKEFPRVLTALDPQKAEIFTHPTMVAALGIMSLHLIYGFLVHAALISYSALKMKDLGWILMRLTIYPIWLVIMVFDIIKPLLNVVAG